MALFDVILCDFLLLLGNIRLLAINGNIKYIQYVA